MFHPSYTDLGPVDTVRQRQCCDKAVMMQAILALIENNGVAIE